jgi:hypothetical protein
MATLTVDHKHKLEAIKKLEIYREKAIVRENVRYEPVTDILETKKTLEIKGLMLPMMAEVHGNRTHLTGFSPLHRI